MLISFYTIKEPSHPALISNLTHSGVFNCSLLSDTLNENTISSVDNGALFLWHPWVLTTNRCRLVEAVPLLAVADVSGLGGMLGWILLGLLSPLLIEWSRWPCRCCLVTRQQESASLPSALRRNCMSAAVMAGDDGMYWHIDGRMDAWRGLGVPAVPLLGDKVKCSSAARYSHC